LLARELGATGYVSSSQSEPDGLIEADGAASSGVS
jgi:hypothetical protein